MKKNVGSIDKIIRLILSLGIFSLFFFLDGNSRYWAVLGLVPLATGLVNFCPLYKIFGLSSCPMKASS